MTSKFFLYIVLTPLVAYATTSVNINGIFKKNHIFTARLFYFILVFILSYLLTNCVYDIFLCSFKIL